MVAVIFCTETSRHVNYSVSNQYLRHRAVSLYNGSNARNKFTFKCWSCHAFNVVHQLPSFWALCFAIFADEVVLLIFVLQTFSWNHSPIYFVCPPLSSLQPFLSRTGHLVAISSLETFQSICIALCCKTYSLLLDIGRNLRHSLVLQWQISNFPYSPKKSVSFVKLFSLKNFTLSLNEAPKTHYFCFLLLIQRSAIQQKSNKAFLPKTFSTVKHALYVQSLCLLLHNNFLFFNISDNCWKSSHNLWTLLNHNSWSLEGLGFEHASARPPYLLPPRFENQTFLGNYRNVFFLR